MNAELEAFVATDNERKTAKAAVMEALGKAKLADLHGINSDAEWAVVTGQGMSGVEGQKNVELVAMADAYVAAHEADFAAYEDMTLEQCVAALDVFRAAGMDAKVVEIEVWLRHKFEPQHIGGKVKARVRLPGGKA